MGIFDLLYVAKTTVHIIIVLFVIGSKLILRPTMLDVAKASVHLKLFKMSVSLLAQH